MKPFCINIPNIYGIRLPSAILKNFAIPHILSFELNQAIWYYKMVRFRTIYLKLHPIAQFEENHIIHKKKLNSSEVNNEFWL